MTEVYPLTLVATRYGGTYEGALFVAFNEYADDDTLHGFRGDDISCANFFSMYERFRHIGRGNNPQEAYQDLQAKLEADPAKAHTTLKAILAADQRRRNAKDSEGP